MRPKLLIVGHADARGRHGLTADLRAAERLGVEPLPVVTAYTVGDNDRQALQPVRASLITRQLTAALDEEPEAALIGVFSRARHAKLIARHLADRGPSAVVLAPMPAAFDITRMVNARLFAAARRFLFPESRAVVLTAPNAGALMGMSADSIDELRAVGEKIRELGADAAWVRAAGDASRRVDVFVDRAGYGLLDYQADAEDAQPHTSAAALAALLALGTKLREAVDRAHRHAYGLDRDLHPV